MTKKPPLILVVDDSVLNRKILETLLQDEGYEVVEAGSGKECFDLAKKLKPDLILLDIMMPGEDGLETCRRLKQDPSTQEIPVIFISALSENKYIVRGLELGGVDYIVKPFSNPEVLARVKVHLGLKFAREQLIEAQAEKLNSIKDAQDSLLISPKDLPEAKFAYVYRSLKEAGGDFLDVLKLGEKQFLYILGDISGHDLGVGYYLSALKALCQQNFELFTPIRDGLNMINKISKKIFYPGQYVTANFVMLNFSSQILYFYNAAHYPLLLLRDNKVKEIYSEGDVLGAFDNFFIEETILEVEKGDRVFLFTDGLLGCSLKFKDKIERLKDVILKFKKFSLKDQIDFVVREMIGNRKIDDDLTFLGIEI